MFLVLFLGSLYLNTLTVVFGSPTIAVSYWSQDVNVPVLYDVQLTQGQTFLRLQLKDGSYTKNIENTWEMMRDSCNSSSTRNIYGWNAQKECLWNTKWQMIDVLTLQITFQACPTFTVFEEDNITCGNFVAANFLDNNAPLEPLRFGLKVVNDSAVVLSATAFGYVKTPSLNPQDAPPDKMPDPLVMVPLSPSTENSKLLGPVYLYEFSLRNKGCEIRLTLRNDAWNASKNKTTFLKGFTCSHDNFTDTFLKPEYIQFSQPVPTMMTYRVPPVGPSFEISSDLTLTFTMTPDMILKAKLPSKENSVALVIRAVQTIRIVLLTERLNIDDSFETAVAPLVISEDCFRGVIQPPSCSKMSYQFYTSAENGVNFVVNSETELLFRESFNGTLGQFQKFLPAIVTDIARKVSPRGEAVFWAFKIAALSVYDCWQNETVSFSLPSEALNLNEPIQILNPAAMKFSIYPSPGRLQGSGWTFTESDVRRGLARITLQMLGETWIRSTTEANLISLTTSANPSQNRGTGWDAYKRSMVSLQWLDSDATRCVIQIAPFKSYNIDTDENIMFSIVPSMTRSGLPLVQGGFPGSTLKIVVSPGEAEFPNASSTCISAYLIKTTSSVSVTIDIFGDRWNPLSLLKTSIPSGVSTSSSEAHGFNTYKSTILSPDAIANPIPGRVIVTLQKAPDYQITRRETLTFSVVPGAVESSRAPVGQYTLCIEPLIGSLYLTIKANGKPLVSPELSEDDVRGGSGAQLELWVTLGNDTLVSPITNPTMLNDVLLGISSDKKDNTSLVARLQRVLPLSSVRLVGNSTIVLTLLNDVFYDISSNETITLSLRGSCTSTGMEPLNNVSFKIFVTNGQIGSGAANSSTGNSGMIAGVSAGGAVGLVVVVVALLLLYRYKAKKRLSWHKKTTSFRNVAISDEMMEPMSDKQVLGEMGSNAMEWIGEV